MPRIPVSVPARQGEVWWITATWHSGRAPRPAALGHRERGWGEGVSGRGTDGFSGLATPYPYFSGYAECTTPVLLRVSIADPDLLDWIPTPGSRHTASRKGSSMDDTRFDDLLRSLSSLSSRRGALGLLLGGPLAVLGLAETEARKRKKRKRKRGGSGGGNNPPPPPPDPNACTTSATTCDSFLGSPAPCGSTGSCACVGAANSGPGTCANGVESSGALCPTGTCAEPGERCISVCGTLICVDPCF